MVGSFVSFFYINKNIEVTLISLYGGFIYLFNSFYSQTLVLLLTSVWLGGVYHAIGRCFGF